MTTPNLGALIADVSSATPAIIYRDGTSRQVIDYGTLRRLIGSIGSWLDERVPAGGSVALIGANSIEWIAVAFAVMATGRVAVPISVKFPPQAMAGVVADSGAHAVVSDQAYELPGVDAERYALADVIATSRDLPSREAADVGGVDPALILYTSGSTGGPKGVVLSHGSHAWVQEVLLAGADPLNDRVLVAAPLYHMNALVNVQATLNRGATVVLLPRFEAGAFLAAIEEDNITAVTGVPPMFALALPLARERGRERFEGVREVFAGSAPASAALIDEITSAFPRATFRLGYGTSESGPIAFADHPGGIPTPRGSVGYPNQEVDLRLVDEQGRPVETGGVLEIRCPGIMLGYRNRPELTRQVITADGFYHTRDVFDVDEHGFFYFRCRADDMIQVGGENVFPQAVAEVLETHPAVLQAAVVGIPDERKGHKPYALVTLAPGARTSADELRTHALRHLEPNQAPRAVFIAPELPLSAVNKVDSRAVVQRIQEQLDTRHTVEAGFA